MLLDALPGGPVGIFLIKNDKEQNIGHVVECSLRDETRTVHPPALGEPAASTGSTEGSPQLAPSRDTALPN